MKMNFKALGTDIAVEIVSKKFYPKLENEVIEFYQQKEKIFSRFDPGSELAFLNMNTGRLIDAASDIIEIAARSLAYYKKTAGYFDPRIIGILENVGYDKDFKDIAAGHVQKSNKVNLNDNLSGQLKIEEDKIYFGCRMDFSGIAKGYITDKAADFLRQKGYDNFLIDSGGDIISSGKDEKGENWKISVEGIEEKNIILELDEKFPAIATSGISRRKWERDGQKYHHLINPKNPGEFNFDLKTVTVMSRTCEEADVWAKTLFLMGKEKGMELANSENINSLFLDYRGNVFLSENIKKNII